MVAVTFKAQTDQGHCVVLYPERVLDRNLEWLLDFGTHTHLFDKELIKSVTVCHIIAR